MAILIDASVNILGFTTVPQLYIRMFYSHDIPGDKIHISLEKYANKQSYMDNIINSLPVDGIPYQLDVPYNRLDDGIDTLGFVHKKIKDHLSTDQTYEEAKTDPSTGEVIFDPSTGEIIYETLVSQLKFTDASNILFVDVDPSII